MNKIETRFAEGDQKKNSLKVKLQKCLNVKGKLNNIEQIEIEYLETDILKVNEFSFLNKKVLQAGGVKTWLVQEALAT